MILVILLLSLSLSFESIDILNYINNELSWNLYAEYENEKSVYQSNEILNDVVITKIQEKVNHEGNDVFKTIFDINQYNNIIKNKNISSYLVSSIDDTIYVYQKVTNMIPFVRDRQYVFKMYKTGKNKINWYILKKTHPLVKNYLDDDVNTLVYGAGSWEMLDGNILVNKIYVDDEVNMPLRLVERIRIKSVVNIFDDILNYLDN